MALASLGGETLRAAVAWATLGDEAQVTLTT